MEEIKNMTEEKAKTADENIDDKEKQKAAREKLLADLRKRSEEANKAIKEGRGSFDLETPILSRGENINKVAYDFTKLTGMEVVAALDSDPGIQPGFKQAFAIFAQAVAKETEGVDAKDVMERMGATDTLEGVQLAVNFYYASIRAGRLRISRR
mgnify:CR=1 FL=1